MKQAIWGLCALLWLNAAGAESDWPAQRARFQAALAALEAGQRDEYSQLAASLADYPLAYYLRYRDIQARFGKSVSDSELRAFLEAYPTSPLADKLRDSWLYALGLAGDWQSYLRVYTPASGEKTVLRCYYLQAALETGQGGIGQEAVQVWLNGASLPDKCNPLFDALYQRQMISTDLIWQRIRLAMDKDNPKLAGALSKRLDRAGQALMARWQTISQNPARELARFDLPDSPLARAMLAHGLRRLATQDAGAARLAWQGYAGRYAFSDEEQGAVAREIALRATAQGLTEAKEWLRALTPAWITEAVSQARLRLAWESQDWPELLAALDTLPAEQRQTPQWRYWRARSLELAGQSEAARPLFAELGQTRDYYGFLAADRAGAAYRIAHQPSRAAGPVEAQRLYAKYPAILRAREFYFVAMQPEARSEWQGAERLMSREDMIEAAYLALSWGWHDRAVFTAAKAGVYDDLDLRFPLAYQPEFVAGAQDQGIDLAWVYGIVRQESAFMHDARSHAGALGLMQLMPATGRGVAKKIGLEISGIQDLLDLPVNIRLGTAYLRQMSDSFDGNTLLATAAYNAGPGRVKRWARERACLPADVWVELIPFEETRGYVRRVLEYTAVFESRLGRQVTPLRLAERATGECAAAPAQVAWQPE